MLIGNLGKDPDIQFLEGNICVAKFPLATTETFKDRTGKLVQQTVWHTVVLWRGLAELAQKYLHKPGFITQLVLGVIFGQHYISNNLLRSFLKRKLIKI